MMTKAQAETALRDYASTAAGRDPLVRSALAAGLTKHRIHQLSGIARTTIDRIDVGTAIVLANLNAYEGGNVWQDVILTLPAYDEAATDAIDTGQNDRFRLTDGTVIRYDGQRGMWYEEAGQ